MSYKIHISDRRYEEYKFVDSRTLDNSHVDGVDVDPISNKLFNQDIFKLLDDGNIILQHSSVRSMPVIPGVLVLNNNKTYGKKGKRFLYKCIPDDRRLPEFLVPYTIKSKFNKSLKIFM